MGGVQWGSATDQSNVYVALSDIGRIMLTYSNSTDADPKQGGGMFALRLETANACGTRRLPDAARARAAARLNPLP